MSAADDPFDVPEVEHQDHEHEYTDNAVCPYCGNVDKDSWEIDTGPGFDGDTQTDCGHCGRTYHVTRNVSVSYSTRKLKDKSG